MLSAMLFFRWGMSLGAVAVVAATVAAQGSRTTSRPTPTPAAARAGTAVEWRQGLAQAKADSRDLARPLFWYLPTIKGSPMDRKPEIDRYMMAGPFSNPDVVGLLNTRFVPVRHVPSRKEGRQLELEPLGFIEPGYLVMSPDGEVLARCHQLTTLHPAWFLSRLGQLVGASRPPARSVPAFLREAWAAFSGGDHELVQESLRGQSGNESLAVRAEAGFLEGAMLLRAGRSRDAIALWRRVAEQFPDEPYAWKCAAEAEGHGPFIRGFEVFTALPEAVLKAESGTSGAPAGIYDEDELRVRSRTFLLGMISSDGGYHDSWYDFGGADSLPNVHVAITALVGRAFLEERVVMDEEDPMISRIDTVLERIFEFVTDDRFINPQDRDEIVWAQIYRIRFLLRWQELRENSEAEVALLRSVRALEKLQPAPGAWFHEYPNPFVTASALVALRLADDAGAAVDRGKVDLGLKALLQCRARNGAFSYGYSRRGAHGVSLRAAAGRMPLCELALSMWHGDGDKKLVGALETAFAAHDELEHVRKYDDHASDLATGGFFFWYDLHGRTEALLAVRDSRVRQTMIDRQRDLILSIPEIDGCFVDSHELGRVYGTAMALICLARLRA